MSQWMPVWLATYLFIAGYIAAWGLTGIFAFLMSENGLPYLGYYAYVMTAVVAAPWVWYFMYLGTRYFDKIPRLYYIWLFAPFYKTVSNTLIAETIFNHTLKFNETIYIINIRAFDLAVVGIILFIGYELCTHRNEYVRLINKKWGCCAAVSLGGLFALAEIWVWLREAAG